MGMKYEATVTRIIVSVSGTQLARKPGSLAIIGEQNSLVPRQPGADIIENSLMALLIRPGKALSILTAWLRIPMALSLGGIEEWPPEPLTVNCRLR
jgi:hypothetical protein